MIKFKERTEQMKHNIHKGNKTMKKIILAAAAFFMVSTNAFAWLDYEESPLYPNESLVAFWVDDDSRHPLQPQNLNITFTNVNYEDENFIITESVDVADIWVDYVFNKKTKTLTKLPDGFISKTIVGDTIISKEKDVFYLNDSAFITKDNELNKEKARINSIINSIEPNAITISNGTACVSPDLRGTGAVLCTDGLISAYTEVLGVNLQYSEASQFNQLKVSKTFIAKTNVIVDAYVFGNKQTHNDENYSISKESAGVGAAVKYSLDKLQLTGRIEKAFTEKSDAITKWQRFSLPNKRVTYSLSAKYRFTDHFYGYVDSDANIGFTYKF